LANVGLIAAVLSYLREPRAGRVFVILVASYLAFLARPDNGLYATIFPLLAIHWLDGSAARLRSIRIFVVGIAVLLAVDAAAKQLLFGDVAPLGYYAKRVGYYDDYAGTTHLNPIENLLVFYRASLPFLVGSVLLVRRRDWRLIATFALPVLLTLVYYFSVVQVMGLYSRYYYPSLPYLLVGSALILDRWYGGAGLSRAACLRHGIVALGLVFAGPVVLQRSAHAFERIFVETRQSFARQLYAIDADRELPAMGWGTAIDAMTEILTGAPSGTVVALSEHGRVGAAGRQLVLIDLVGLHDREFAHRGFSTTALFDREPDLIWGPHPNYVGIVEEILCDRRFWEEYDYYPNAFSFGLAVRRASPRRVTLRGRIDAEWHRRYGEIEMSSHRAEPVEPSSHAATRCRSPAPEDS
jgi:hypothetical protein